MKPSIVVALIALISSCGRVICTPPRIYVWDRHQSATPDTFIKIIAFQANTNFSQFKDSVTMSLGSVNDMYTFTTGKDYRIITLPSNTQHTVTRLSFGNEKGSSAPGKDADRCNTSVNMLVDDSLFHYNMQDMNGGDGYIYMYLF
jgi:hypothetical protein